MKTGPLAQRDGKETKCLLKCRGMCVFRVSFVLSADGEIADPDRGQRACGARGRTEDFLA
jgi:hypothetical protein